MWSLKNNEWVKSLAYIQDASFLLMPPFGLQKRCRDSLRRGPLTEAALYYEGSHFTQRTMSQMESANYEAETAEKRDKQRRYLKREVSTHATITQRKQRIAFGLIRLLKSSRKENALEYIQSSLRIT